MRKQGVNIPDVKPQPLSGIITQKREYKLITPLFGGGVEPGEYDEHTPIRGSEIRGHLRFWWRACFGGRYETVKEMKEAEDRIWGTAAQSKKKKEEKEGVQDETGGNATLHKMTVQIDVEILEKGQSVEPFKIKPAFGKKAKNGDKWIDEYNADLNVLLV